MSELTVLKCGMRLYVSTCSVGLEDAEAGRTSVVDVSILLKDGGGVDLCLTRLETRALIHDLESALNQLQD